MTRPARDNTHLDEGRDGPCMLFDKSTRLTLNIMLMSCGGGEEVEEDPRVPHIPGAAALTDHWYSYAHSTGNKFGVSS